MAITWEFEGTIIDTKFKEISASATRTDSESSDPPVVVTLDKVSVNSNVNKLRALDVIHAKAEKELQRRINEVAFQAEIDELEIQAKNNLEARDN